MYLVVVMDLYSRRIVGWHIDKRMMMDLIGKALIKNYNLRQPPYGLVFHCDCGLQHISQQFRKLLLSYDIRASIRDASACWNNAVVKRFFGCLKYDWLYKVNQATRAFMKQGIVAYIKYYNSERLHSANDDLSPVDFENSKLKVSSLGLPEHTFKKVKLTFNKCLIYLTLIRKYISGIKIILKIVTI